jgi:hypothetical protein
MGPMFRVKSKSLADTHTSTGRARIACLQPIGHSVVRMTERHTTRSLSQGARLVRGRIVTEATFARSGKVVANPVRPDRQRRGQRNGTFTATGCAAIATVRRSPSAVVAMNATSSGLPPASSRFAMSSNPELTLHRAYACSDLRSFCSLDARFSDQLDIIESTST